MLLQLLVVVGLVCFLVNLVLNLKSLRVPKLDAVVQSPVPLVSILVPARNEEINIRACLECLRLQDYPNFEVLVLDDNSTDNTYASAMSIAELDQRFRVIAGLPLPEGWTGKAFACNQLARAASGEWLLFIDADTR
ncbi:MAG: glycosyltransferase family 2 protein, partial [Dehalococcoidia bacterium]|nr:glycosyltransferase family 2 protein [Dehalococcoidia bacterium]